MSNNQIFEDIASEMKHNNDRRYEFALELRKRNLLNCDRKNIKTIASYYFSIVNGGLQRNRCKLAELWLKMGYKVIVLTDFEPTPDDYDLPPEIERVMVPDYRKVTPDNYGERAAAFQKIIRDYQVDLVVYHAWLLDFMLWDEIAIKSTGCAFAASTHNIFSLPLFEGWTSFRNIIAPYIIADAVITQNKVSTEFWRSYNANVHTVMNRLPDSPDKWCASRCDNHEIVWVGRIAKEKNPFDLIRIMEIVKDAVPDARLHVVGSGKDKAYYDSFITEIRKINLENVIITHGFQKEVHTFYQNASIMLLTSSYESYCNSLQEGLLAGLPVVMYSLPYLTLTEGNPGIIQVGMNDTAAIAESVIGLLRDDEKRRKSGEEARNFILRFAEYDYEKIWREIFDIHQAETSVPENSAERMMVHTFVDHHEIGIRKLKRECAEKDNVIKKQMTEIKKQKAELAAYDRKLVRLALQITHWKDAVREKGLKGLWRKT